MYARLTVSFVFHWIGQLVSSHMQPGQLAFHPETAFVEMGHLGGEELVFDGGQARLRLVDYKFLLTPSTN